MSVQVACPHCEKKYQVPEKVMGRRVKCKKCEKPFAAEPMEVAVFDFVDDLADIEEEPAKSPSSAGKKRERTRSADAAAISVKCKIPGMNKAGFAEQTRIKVPMEQIHDAATEICKDRPELGIQKVAISLDKHTQGDRLVRYLFGGLFGAGASVVEMTVKVKSNEKTWTQKISQKGKMGLFGGNSEKMLETNFNCALEKLQQAICAEELETSLYGKMYPYVVGVSFLVFIVGLIFAVKMRYPVVAAAVEKARSVTGKRFAWIFSLGLPTLAVAGGAALAIIMCYRLFAPRKFLTDNPSGRIWVMRSGSSDAQKTTGFRIFASVLFLVGVGLAVLGTIMVFGG